VRHNEARRPEIGVLPVRVDGAGGRIVPFVPRAPTGLTAASRRRWAEYWGSKVAAAADPQSDRHRIERWIVSVDEYERVMAVFKRTRLVKGSTGQPVLNPLAGYLEQVRNDLTRAENELGLTPLARQRLGIAYGEAAMTALELNRQLDALDDPDGDRATPVLELGKGTG
jgi:P27 family predicted phage terminase small subunit